MSLMDMNRAFKKFGPAFGIALAAIILVGTFAGFGANILGGDPAGPAGTSPSATDTVATVGEAKVTRALLQNNLDRALQQQAMLGGAPPQPKPEEMDRYLVGMLDQVKQQQALAVSARAAGVTVSDSDIAAEREKVWQQERVGFAGSLGLPAAATDQEIDRAISSQDPGRNLAAIKEGIPSDALRIKLYQEGYQKKLRDQVQVDPALLKRTYNEVQVRHILINFGEKALPEAQAKAKAAKILAEIKSNPAKMAQLAKENSDDPGSKTKGGFYDWAPAAQYVPAFTEAALKAGVGKVYPDLVRVVQSNYSGFHIVKLEGERTPKSTVAPAKGAAAAPDGAAPTVGLPADFAKNQQKYVDEYRDKIASAQLQAAVAAALPSVKVEITDSALRAAQLQTEAQRGPDKKATDAKLTLALAELGKVAKDSPSANNVALQKAAILQQLGRDKEAITAYTEALKYRNLPEIHISLAQLYLKQKDTANAKEQLAEAQKLPIGDIQTQAGLSSLLTQAGDKDGAKKAMDKAMEMLKRQQMAQQSAMPAPPPPPAGEKPTSGG
ncbi:MAG: peptidylprolyl isomerase [Cytophagales bacterium]|nr:peptidylprolyl isomerase [Armatimonadota bacterium]